MLFYEENGMQVGAMKYTGAEAHPSSYLNIKTTSHIIQCKSNILYSTLIRCIRSMN